MQPTATEEDYEFLSSIITPALEKKDIISLGFEYSRTRDTINTFVERLIRREVNAWMEGGILQ